MKALKGQPRRLYCFTYAYEPVTEAISIEGGADDRFLLEPVTGAAVLYDEGWVLIDTGFNTETIRDLDRRREHYTVAPVPCIPPGEPLLDEVARAGLRWEDLAFACISHLHCDHSGGLRHLVDGPEIVMQRREHEFAMDEAGLEDAFFRSDYELTGLNWELIDGDAELAPGLRAVDTAGHTPGHQSFAIDLGGQGTVVLACDAADLQVNITQCITCGTTTHPALADDARRATERLHRLNLQPDVEVWPGHDPDFWPTRRRPPASYA